MPELSKAANWSRMPDHLYTNAPGRAGGSIKILRGGEDGSGYILFSGVWKQDDGKEGELDLVVSAYANAAEVHWGPDKTITNEWTKNIEEQP
ncbi:hypothetical protein [Paracoccus benzoatiresistens]|uniref:Uncharacterized protein n=1 Tax=Paracoccus benzoatiresistens TaxID=2997341 RepID=A0ABT4J8P6_9RHOB|nr:hypothetical protein [Paracoccus sp. EF6]MCZ0963498.1 hypothetical protein [Paracoccus sp. EF6]